MGDAAGADGDDEPDEADEAEEADGVALEHGQEYGGGVAGEVVEGTATAAVGLSEAADEVVPPVDEGDGDGDEADDDEADDGLPDVAAKFTKFDGVGGYTGVAGGFYFFAGELAEFSAVDPEAVDGDDERHEDESDGAEGGEEGIGAGADAEDGGDSAGGVAAFGECAAVGADGMPAEDEGEGKCHGDDGGIGFGAAVGGGDEGRHHADDDAEFGADDDAPDGGEEAAHEGQGDDGPGFEGFPAGDAEEVGEAPAEPEPGAGVVGGHVGIGHVVGCGAVGEAGEVFGAEGLVSADAMEVELGGGEGEAKGDGDDTTDGEGREEAGPEVGGPVVGVVSALGVEAAGVCPYGAGDGSEAEEDLGNGGEGANEVAVAEGGEVGEGEYPEDEEWQEEAAQEGEESEEADG